MNTITVALMCFVIAQLAYSQEPTKVEAANLGGQPDSDQLEVVSKVLSSVRNSIHVRRVIFMDAELPFVPEQEAPGVSNYRQQITPLLNHYEVTSRLHQSLIDEVAKDGEQYRVLILKTNLAIPYTSIFIHLDCKYWSAENERDLRKAMNSHGSPR